MQHILEITLRYLENYIDKIQKKDLLNNHQEVFTLFIRIDTSIKNLF